MVDATPTPQSRREAVQPSLWDRLVDDLPGIVTETDHRRADLAAVIGADRLTAILADGLRGIERDTELTDQQRRDLGHLITALDRRAFLEQRGIVVTPDVLREAVRRDIEALFNVERFQSRPQLTDLEMQGREAPEDIIVDFPHARLSVLNYGVPSFSGRRAADFDLDALARELKDVVAFFEPRFKRDTIRVKVGTGDSLGMRIQIEGTLLLSPVPERLRLSTTVDLDSGRATTAVEDA
jgi:type VI secretion system protein ImpF